MPSVYSPCNEKCSTFTIEEQDIIAKPPSFFYKSLAESMFPEYRTLAQVIPLFKKDDLSIVLFIDLFLYCVVLVN